MTFPEFLMNKARSLDNGAAHSGNHIAGGASRLRDISVAYEYGQRGDPLESMPSMVHLAKEYQKIVDPDYDLYLTLKERFE